MKNEASKAEIEQALNFVIKRIAELEAKLEEALRRKSIIRR